jgi:hypothetical protein
MHNAVKIDVTFPYSGLTYTFKSIRAVARMLSGNGTASGGLRTTISEAALNGAHRLSPNVVRNNELADSQFEDQKVA